MKMQEELAKVVDFKYLAQLHKVMERVWKKSEEESTGRVEWVEKNVRSDL